MNNPKVIEEKQEYKNKRIEELGLTKEKIAENKKLIAEVSADKAQELAQKLTKKIGSKYYNENDDKKYDEVLALIKEGANLDYENEKGNFPLIVCARKGYLKTFITLLKFGANIHKVNKNKTTLAMSSARNGWSDILEITILLDVDLNALCDDGDTALIMAKRHGRTKCFEMLVNNNVILNTKNCLNLTSYQIQNISGGDKIDDAKYYAAIPTTPLEGTIHEDAMDLIEEATCKLNEIKEASIYLTPPPETEEEPKSNLSFAKFDLPDELTQGNINTNFKVK